jgi:hypothetical protein
VHLSSEQFYSIIESLRSDGRDGKTTERRKQPRVGLSAIATIEYAMNKLRRRVDVRVRNISKSGIGFIHDEPIEAGTNITLCLGGDGKGGRLKDLQYIVMSCRSLEAELFAIGAKVIGFGEE